MARAFGWNDALRGAERAMRQARPAVRARSRRARGRGGVRPLALDIPYGRLSTSRRRQGRGAFQAAARGRARRARLQQCAAGAGRQAVQPGRLGEVPRRVVVDVVAEGWGQGHARASALGVAGMMAMLAAAANGQAEVRAPHLVDALRGVGLPTAAEPHGRWPSASARRRDANRIPREAAEVIIEWPVVQPSRRDRAPRLRAGLRCTHVLARSTGSPARPARRRFPTTTRSLVRARPAVRAAASKTRRDRDACGPLRPYKWYVAAYRTDPEDPRWTKVIGVLTERNWFAAPGRVHGAGDTGPNPAAEIAMQIAGRTRACCRERPSERRLGTEFRGARPGAPRAPSADRSFGRSTVR